jgi:hypothetical protein
VDARQEGFHVVVEDDPVVAVPVRTKLLGGASLGFAGVGEVGAVAARETEGSDASRLEPPGRLPS